MKHVLIALIVCIVLVIAAAGCTSTPAPSPANTPDGAAVGAVPVHSEDGVTVYKNPDGSYYGVDKDGTKVQINPDGSWSGTAEDGSSASMDKDGNYNYQGSDGSSVVGNNNEGNIDGGDGSSLTYTVDEKGVVHYKMVEPDGKVTTWTSDGSITSGQ